MKGRLRRTMREFLCAPQSVWRARTTAELAGPRRPPAGYFADQSFRSLTFTLT